MSESRILVLDNDAVRAERTGAKVRQVTLLNLRRHFAIGANEGSSLCRSLFLLL